MGKGSRNTTAPCAFKQRNCDSMRLRNLARSAERFSAWIDGSTLTVAKAVVAALRRQECYLALLGKTWGTSRRLLLNLWPKGTASARYAGLSMFSRPSSDISVHGSERIRVGADGTAARTSDCSSTNPGAVAKVLASRALHSDWVGKFAALSSLGVTPMSIGSAPADSGDRVDAPKMTSPPGSVRFTDDVRGAGRSVSPLGWVLPSHREGG